MLHFGCTPPHEAQIAPHIYFCTPIAFQNLEGNCSSNGTSTTIPMTCAALSTWAVPSENSRCAQSIADSVRWQEYQDFLREAVGDFVTHGFNGSVHSDDGAHVPWSYSTPTSLHNSSMRLNGRGFVSRSAGFRSVGIFTTSSRPSSLAACSQRCLVCTCFANPSP